MRQNPNVADDEEFGPPVKGKKRKKDTRSHWAGDCETDPFKRGRVPKPFLWGLYTGSGYHEYRTAEEFVEAIKDNDVIVYFHNGGKFDFHFLLPWINLHEEMKIINGRLVSCKIGKAEIRDSWNLLPAPLSTFGSKLEIDYAKLEEDVRHLHMAEISRYMQQDCVGLWEAIDEFERSYGRHLTQAGAAMAQWTKISGKKPPKTDRAFFQKFSQYYYGGRVQCFERGYIKGPVKVFDIRSAYPWAMLDKHPYGPMYIERAFPREVFPTSMVTVECVSHGALPMKTEKGGTIFPDDGMLRIYHTTGHEYLAAVECGLLTKARVLNAIDFVDLQDFKPYIEYFYELRKKYRLEDNVAQVLFTKLLMNSLYGKFGANPDNYGNFMLVPFSEMTDHEEEGYFLDGLLGPNAVLRRNLDPWQENFINVATAASITGQVRAHLMRAIHASKRPIYCDTDSLMCTDAALPIGEELGEWNFEGTATDAWIAGKKMYYLKGIFEKGKREKQATKGVRLTGAQIKKAATGGTVTAYSDAPTFTLKGKRGTYFQERRVRATN